MTPHLPGPLSDLGPSQLTEARLLSHWAAQVPAAIASSLVCSQEDDSHSNLGWDETRGALFSHALDKGPREIVGARVGIRFDPLSVVGLRGTDAEWSIELDGQTLDQALAATRESLALDSGVAVTELPATPLRDYDMPEHSVARGVSFNSSAQHRELAELRSWFSAFDVIFESFRAGLGASAGTTDVSVARVWPHHFDLGLLASLKAGIGPGAIGIGMSPGDEHFAQPYLYVSPYPWPEDNPPLEDALPAGGFWNERGFRGAALLAESLVEHSGEESGEYAARFLESAVGALTGAP